MAEYRHQREVDARPAGAGRVLGLCASALAGLFAGFAALNVLVTKDLWHPPLPRFEEITSELEAVKDQVEVLFLGPSHMMTDIDPRVFDARMAALGRPLFSYNYSVESLMVSERDYLLERLREIRPKGLRYVLVKPDVWIHTTLVNTFSTRTRYFNRPATVRRYLELRLGSTKPFFTYNLPTSLVIAWGGLMHLSNVGVISDLILPPKSALTEPAGERHPERRGYLPLDDEKPKDSGDDSPYPVQPPSGPVRQLSAGELAELARLFREIRELGAEPVVLIPPVGNDNLADTAETLAAMATTFPEVAVLSFHPSGQSPELYEKLGYWADRNHLSPAGATRFSTLLADRFATLLNSRGGAP